MEKLNNETLTKRSLNNETIVLSPLFQKILAQCEEENEGIDWYCNTPDIVFTEMEIKCPGSDM